MFFPKMSAYERDFDKTECIFFLKKDKILLEKYNETWKKVSKIIIIIMIIKRIQY